MYPAPNPVTAAATVFAATMATVRAHADPPPKTGPYDGGWTGQFCAFIYSAECLYNMPTVPDFGQAATTKGDIAA